MSCDLTSPRRPRRPLVAGALLASILLLTAACGHKKSPTPPPSKVPRTVTLTAHQRGHEVVLSFPFPTTTISGTPLPGISKIEIWQFGVEVPEFAVELLAEEAQRRKEAQELLDELGLPLYEVPVVDPAAGLQPGLPGTPSGPVATGEPTPQGEGPAELEDAQPMQEDLDPTEAQEPSGEMPADDAAAEEPPPVEMAESTDEMDEAAGQDDAGSEAGEAGSEDDPDAAAGEEVELTEEEQQAIAIEAARNLLKSPPTPKSSFITATTKDFKKGSEMVVSVEGDEVARALIGDRLVFRLSLPARPDEGPEIGYLFSATVYALNGKPSDPSQRVAILPADTPPAPKNMEVVAQSDGIHLTWSADEDPAAGFRIYRRDAHMRLYGDPIAQLALASERTFVDRQAVFGARYIYGVTAVESSSPLLESDMSTEHEIDYQDRFGPITPSGLVAFPEAGRVRLLWTPSPNLDVAGYDVLRRSADEEDPRPLNDLLVERGQFLDETVTSGEVWFYSVVAVDTSGNRSEASAETEVRVP